jgi:micrococcal nuclease
MKRRTVCWLLVAWLAVVGVGCSRPQRAVSPGGHQPQPTAPPGKPASPSGTVTRVVDGDTIVVEGVGKVRLIGVDTPETVHPRKPVKVMGREAAAATKRLGLGKTVRLETDVQTHDRYGRFLAYVWLPDGTMLNAELVRLGYARVSTYPPNVKYQDRFVALERDAREAERGLWSRR